MHYFHSQGASPNILLQFSHPDQPGHSRGCCVWVFCIIRGFSICSQELPLRVAWPCLRWGFLSLINLRELLPRTCSLLPGVCHAHTYFSERVFPLGRRWFAVGTQVFFAFGRHSSISGL